MAQNGSLFRDDSLTPRQAVLAISHAEGNPFGNMEKTCRCPAKRPLVGRGRSSPNPLRGPGWGRVVQARLRLHREAN